MTLALKSDEQYLGLVSACLLALADAKITSHEIRDLTSIWRVKFGDLDYTVITGSDLKDRLKSEEDTVLISWSRTPVPFFLICGGKVSYLDLRFRLASRNLNGLAKAINDELRARGIDLFSFDRYLKPKSKAQMIAERIKGYLASGIRRRREGKKSPTIIIFVGPIASGKTTQRNLLSRFFVSSKARFITLTFPPFAFFSNSVASFFKEIVSVSNLRKKTQKGLHPFDYLEDNSPNVLRKTIRQLALIDLLQELVFLFYGTIITRLGFYILVEDFLPPIELDHDLFIKLYSDDQQSKLLPRIYDRLRGIVRRALPARTICIVLQANGSTRLGRSVARGYRRVDIGSVHDKYRELNLELISKSMFEECIVLNTENRLIKEVHLDLLSHLRAHDIL